MPARKLTTTQAIELFTRRKNGESPSVLAIEYGVSERTVQRLMRGRHYKEVYDHFILDSVQEPVSNLVVSNQSDTGFCALQQTVYKDGSIKVVDDEGKFIEVKHASVRLSLPNGRRCYHIYRDVKIISSNGKTATGEVINFEHPNGGEPCTLRGNVELDDVGGTFYPSI